MSINSPSQPSAPKAGNTPYIPELGDLIKLEFSPHAGTEQGGYRRAIVLTPYEYNAKVGRCYGCPTTGESTGYPFEVPIPEGLKVYGVVLSDQGKALDFRARGAKFVDRAPQSLIDEVKAQIGDFLQI